MSTKNIKAGLSKANVNAIAGAIGTATLNRLVPQFSTSVSYTKGQYTNYNNQLYRFTSDKSAGAWDSSKVESASLNDLINDVNSAVASVDGKANVDGNYPTMTVGLSDNLTPYGEDSGAEQDNPFISNGTGTNNNTEIVTVGDYGLLRSKNGNTICVNNQLQNGNFASSSGWGSGAINVLNVSDNIATFTATAQYGRIYHSVQFVKGHTYYYSCSIKTSSNTNKIKLGVAVGVGAKKAVSSVETTNWQRLSGIYDYSVSADFVLDTVLIYDERTENWDAIQVKDVQVVDLTQMFNGDIPQDLLDNPDHFSWYYNGDLLYNTGTLVNADGVKLVSTGRNLWDEETLNGSINTTTGQYENIGTNLVSENYIRVIPNAVCFINTNKWDYVCMYDENQNYIGTLTTYQSITGGYKLNIPANCLYIKFKLSSSYGTNYNNDITISLYYTPEQGGEGYDKYYPYETPYKVDTGNEVLRSAGSVKDIKKPSGEITRNLNELTFTGNENVGTQISGDTYYISISGMADGRVVVKSNLYVCDTNNSHSIGDQDNYSIITYSGRIYIRDTSCANADALKTKLTGSKLIYPLATPTTEQGTPFAENLPINDYGMLYWLDTNGVPQGNTIFFPVNYKGFVDDMYSRVDGDSSQYVIKEELQASETVRDAVDSQLLNAVGGTLRHCLCVKESLDFDNTDFIDLGTLDWSYNTTYHFFIVNISSLNAVYRTTPKMLSTKYSVVNVRNTSGSYSGDGITFIRDGNPSEGTVANNLRIDDSSYTDATTFKNAMKGILLAYEKASE